MIETAVEMDETALENYLEGMMPSNDEIRALIRKGTIAVKFFPMFCGSAFKNKGVQPLLDGVVDFLPSPVDVPAIKGIDAKTEAEIVRKADDAEPLSMLAFKIMNDPFVGSLTFCRIYSGKLTKGVSLDNTVKGKKERIGRMLQMHANSRADIDEAFAGDIVALAGLKETTTGDTLCDPLKPVILERMEFPEPVIQIAIEPKTKGDQEKMGLALHRLAAEDPSFRVKTDEESGQTIIAGMGELHLDIIVDRMRREFKVEANVGAPQVAYRETITRRHEQSTTPTRSSPAVRASSPASRSSSSRIRRARNSCSNPRSSAARFRRNTCRASRRASRACMSSGPFAGFPMIGVKATLIDGAYHDVDFSVLAFEIAGRAAFREAAPKAGAQLLEPIMKVEVVTPEDYVGNVIGDLNSPARPDPGPGSARHRRRHQRDGAARQHVQICRQPALDEPGPCPVHDAVRPLRAGADRGRAGSSEEIRVIPAA